MIDELYERVDNEAAGVRSKLSWDDQHAYDTKLTLERARGRVEGKRVRTVYLLLAAMSGMAFAGIAAGGLLRAQRPVVDCSVEVATWSRKVRAASPSSVEWFPMGEESETLQATLLDGTECFRRGVEPALICLLPSE